MLRGFTGIGVVRIPVGLPKGLSVDCADVFRGPGSTGVTECDMSVLWLGLLSLLVVD